VNNSSRGPQAKPGHRVEICKGEGEGRKGGEEGAKRQCHEPHGTKAFKGPPENTKKRTKDGKKRTMKIKRKSSGRGAFIVPRTQSSPWPPGKGGVGTRGEKTKRARCQTTDGALRRKGRRLEGKLTRGHRRDPATGGSAAYSGGWKEKKGETPGKKNESLLRRRDAVRKKHQPPGQTRSETPTIKGEAPRI